jgi:hypothetical protein
MVCSNNFAGVTGRNWESYWLTKELNRYDDACKTRFVRTKVKSAKKSRTLDELVEIAYARLAEFSPEEQQARLRAAAKVKFNRPNRKTISKSRRAQASASSHPKRRASARTRAGR